MKPFLCFLGGCEFEYIIAELRSNPQQYLDFDYFYSFEHRGETNPYTFLADHAQEVFEKKPDLVFLSQHDMMMIPITDIQLNGAVSREQQDQQLKELLDQCELMILTLLPLNVPIVMQFFPWFRTNMLNRFKQTGPLYNEDQFMRKYAAAMEELAVRYPGFYFFNLTGVCSLYGFRETLKQMDAPWYSHIQFPAAHLAREYTHWINYILRRDKKVKCVIVDLDNTMWKGVIRDVGVENIEVRIDKERFHWNVLAILYARGILIGVISKNDPYLESDIRSFIKPHLVGVCIGLRKDRFYEIDTLLFSCRVMSKGVEDYTLTSVLNDTRRRNFDQVIVRFKKGPKNEQMQTILSNNRFIESACEGDSVIYRFDLKQQDIKPLPKWFCPAQPDVEKIPALSS